MKSDYNVTEDGVPAGSGVAVTYNGYSTRVERMDVREFGNHVVRWGELIITFEAGAPFSMYINTTTDLAN